MRNSVAVALHTVLKALMATATPLGKVAASTGVPSPIGATLGQHHPEFR